MLFSCFLSSRSNDVDLNNQVAAILHLGNISFVEAGNEVVIAVLILGIVLCHHYSRQLCHHYHCHHGCSSIFNICSLISYLLGETTFYWASLIIASLDMIADLHISQFLVMSYDHPSKVAKPEDEAALDFPAHLLQVRHNYFSMNSYIIKFHISLSKKSIFTSLVY